MATTNIEFHQLMEGATRFGYSIQTALGTDPANGRIRLPGAVIGNPALVEDRKHETYHPLGADILAQFAQTLGEEFTFTLEHLLEESFVGANEFMSLAFGVIDGTTGAITLRRPLRPWVGEWGWQSKFEQEIEVTVSGADDGTYTVTINGIDYDFVASSSTVSLIVAGLQTVVDADPNVAAVDNDPILTITAEVAGTPFTFSLTAPSDNLEVTTTKNVGWYHLLTGGKINTTTLTMTGGEKIIAQHEIMARIHEDGRVTEVDNTGDNLSDLVAYTGPSARFKDVTFLFKKQSGTVIDVKVTDFEITFANSLTADHEDNQNLFAGQLTEGEVDITFTLTTKKINNDLLDISRGDASSDAGKLDLTVTIDQDPGFYMQIAMPQIILSNRTAELGQGLTKVVETFDGQVIGSVAIDMNKLA